MAKMAKMARAARETKKSMKPGGGGRFQKLEKELAERGAENPAALAAWIGMKKYGKERMLKWAQAARKRGKTKRG